MEDRKSTTGYVIKIGNSVVSWSSQKQKSVALSTMEAEYVAMAESVKEGMWIMQILDDIGIKSKIQIKCDNQAAIKILKNNVQHSKAKHININMI